MEYIDPGEGFEYINPWEGLEFINPGEGLEYINPEEGLEFINPGEGSGWDPEKVQDGTRRREHNKPKPSLTTYLKLLFFLS